MSPALPISASLPWISVVFTVAGGWLWVASVRRQADPRLSLLQRVLLAAVLALLPFACRQLDRAFAERYPEKISPGITRSLARQLDLETPDATTLGEANIKFLGPRPVLMALPPAQLSWNLDPSVRAVSLRFGFDPAAYQQGAGNGADLTVELEGKAFLRPVFHRHLDPVRVAADRGLQSILVSLPAFEPGARLILRTGAGEFNDASWDWLYLARVRFLPGLRYAAAQFPGFNRVPDLVAGDTTSVVPWPDGGTRLFVGTPASFTFRLAGTEHRLVLAYGFLPGAYRDGGHTDGVVVRVRLASAPADAAPLFSYHADPVAVAADRGLLPVELPLAGKLAGDSLLIELLPYGNNGWDQIYIEQLTID